MEAVLRLTTFEEANAANIPLAFWLSRSPSERIAEVERLRHEYIQHLRGPSPDGASEGLRGSLRVVEWTDR